MKQLKHYIQYQGLSPVGNITDGGAYIVENSDGQFQFESCTEKESKRTFKTEQEAINYYIKFIEHKKIKNISWKKLW
jgi:hypothetical protein